MALLTWSDKYSVKIPSIDKQHIKLFEMINEFYDELDKKSNHELIKELITKMKLYTQMHFATEEKLFKKHQLPNYMEHINEHRDFIDKVSDLEQKMANGTLILSFEITNFLKTWIKTHILCTDMNYVDFLKSKGVI